MKKVLPVVLLLFCSLVFAERFAISGAGVSFVPPDGFTELTQAEIENIYPGNDRPEFVVGDAGRATTIAFGIKNQNINPNDLPGIKDAFEKLFSRAVPGIEWKDRKIIRLAGRDWVYLEFRSNGSGRDVHNMMLVTAHRGKMLTLNFNSGRNDFPRMERALRQSVASIQVKD